MCISKSREFLQNFKNRAGDKLKLPKRKSPAGIGRLGMSGLGGQDQSASQSSGLSFENLISTEVENH